MDAEQPSSATGPDAPSDALSPPEHLLLSTPHLDDCEDRLCAALSTVAPPAGERVLVVTVTDTVGDAHRRWDRQVGERPAAFAVVSVDFHERGGFRPDDRDATPSSTDRTPAWVTPHTVPDPADLTGLGVEISGQLAEWEATDDPVVVCLRSLTTMLQYVELEELVRFLQVLQEHLAACDAVSHFHLDPTAVDDETVRSLSHVFDRVVEATDGGDVERSEVG